MTGIQLIHNKKRSGARSCSFASHHSLFVIRINSIMPLETDPMKMVFFSFSWYEHRIDIQQIERSWSKAAYEWQKPSNVRSVTSEVRSMSAKYQLKSGHLSYHQTCTLSTEPQIRLLFHSRAHVLS